MIRRALLTVVFVLLSGLLLLWLFAHWYSWDMAEFDCDAGYWACRSHLIPRMAWRVGIPVIGWVLLGWLLVREWKKD